MSNVKSNANSSAGSSTLAAGSPDRFGYEWHNYAENAARI